MPAQLGMGFSQTYTSHESPTTNNSVSFTSHDTSSPFWLALWKQLEPQVPVTGCQGKEVTARMISEAS